MQFAKMEASCCSCWGIQYYDPGRDVRASFLKAPISTGSQHWSHGLLLQLENNQHIRLINPCSNSINLLNGVITWMNLPLCSSTYKYGVAGMSEVNIFLFVLVQREASWPAGKPPHLLGFWALHSINGAGAPARGWCIRVQTHQQGSWHPPVYPHFLLSLSQAGIACLISQLLRHSLSILLCGFLFLCLCLIVIYLLAAPCQKSSSAWTVSLGKGLLKISSRAAVLTYHCIGSRSRTEMKNSEFLFVFFLIF